jgi:hypothetical protein
MEINKIFPSGAAFTFRPRSPPGRHHRNNQKIRNVSSSAPLTTKTGVREKAAPHFLQLFSKTRSGLGVPEPPNLRRDFWAYTPTLPLTNRRDVGQLAQSCQSRPGRACPLCPGNSDINLFSYSQGIIDFDT